MELRAAIDLIHLSAGHATQDARRKAIAEYLRCHPEIDREEAYSVTAEPGTG
jgi:hypothetical protein